MTEIITAKEACATASLSLKNNACGTPDNVILSASEDKIRGYIYSMINKLSMKGQFYLPLYVYGAKAKQAFMCVAKEMYEKERYSFVIGTLPNDTMMVTITWKEAWDKGYEPFMKIME